MGNHIERYPTYPTTMKASAMSRRAIALSAANGTDTTTPHQITGLPSARIESTGVSEAAKELLPLQYSMERSISGQLHQREA